MTDLPFMNLTDKTYPVNMNLVQMAGILNWYNNLDTCIYREKKVKEELRSVVEEIRQIWDEWIIQRNENIRKMMEKRANDGLE